MLESGYFTIGEIFQIQVREPLDWDGYNQDMPVAENGQSIPEYEFNQCVSW